MLTNKNQEQFSIVGGLHMTAATSQNKSQTGAFQQDHLNKEKNLKSIYYLQGDPDDDLAFENDGDEDFNESNQFDDDDEDGVDIENSINNSSMLSRIASQHPLSADEDIPLTTEQDEQLSQSQQDKLKERLIVSTKESSLIILYLILYLGSIVAPPILFYSNCKNSPHYISHIIFLCVQFIFVVMSGCFYRYRFNLNTHFVNIKQFDVEGQITMPKISNINIRKNQGRCCREIISQMQLMDTYTNVCFATYVIYEFKSMPLYMTIIVAASIGITLLIKLLCALILLFFTLVKIRKLNAEKDSSLVITNAMKSFIKLLIWLDLENLARLYDPEDNNLVQQQSSISSNSTDSRIFLYHKVRHSFFKTVVEDIPFVAMQALYLAFNLCSNGLNSVIILSLYFNCVCMLYSLTTLCSKRNKRLIEEYNKEICRLRDYYHANVKIIAEFYIEDNIFTQNLKLKALNAFLAEHEYKIQSFNFSANQISEESIGYLNEIILHSSETLEDLQLSRCKLKPTDLLKFSFSDKLKRLNLSENRLGDSGLKIICNYISENNKENLLSLNLDSTNITNNGAIMILKALTSGNNSIISLSMKKNNLLTQLTFFEITRHLQQNYLKYYVEKTNMKIQESFAIKLSQNENMDRVLQTLFRIDSVPIVRSMDLSMRFFRQSKLQQVEQEETQKKNGMLFNNQTQQLVAGLKNYDLEQQMIFLSIQHNINLKKNIHQDYKQYLNDKVFYLGTSISIINLSSNWFSIKAQDIIFKAFSQCPNLKELIYNSNQITKPKLFFKCISNCSQLEKISLKQTLFRKNDYVLEFKHSLSKLVNMKHLALNYSNVTDQIMRDFSIWSLINLHQLEKITLKCCGLSSNSLDPLLENLHFTKISNLNLSQNSLKDCLEIGKFIKVSKTISQLKLSRTQIQDNELKQISYGLKINKSLTILDLSQNQIKNISHIKEGIQCNIRLEKIDLSNNVIDDQNLVSLSESLCQNQSLETISVSFNDYKLSGIKTFLSVFEINKTLQNVSLSIPQFLETKEIVQFGNCVIETLRSMTGYFKKLELLGKMKKLTEERFYFTLIKEGCQNIEEIIIDSMLKEDQVQDMVKGLQALINGVKTDLVSLEVFNSHKLKKITFIKPQDHSQHIQELENLLEEKQNILFLPMKKKTRQPAEGQQQNHKATLLNREEEFVKKDHEPIKSEKKERQVPQPKSSNEAQIQIQKQSQSNSQLKQNINDNEKSVSKILRNEDINEDIQMASSKFSSLPKLQILENNFDPTNSTLQTLFMIQREKREVQQHKMEEEHIQVKDVKEVQPEENSDNKI